MGKQVSLAHIPSYSYRPSSGSLAKKLSFRAWFDEEAASRWGVMARLTFISLTAYTAPWNLIYPPSGFRRVSCRLACDGPSSKAASSCRPCATSGWTITTCQQLSRHFPCHSLHRSSYEACHTFIMASLPPTSFNFLFYMHIKRKIRGFAWPLG